MAPCTFYKSTTYNRCDGWDGEGTGHHPKHSSHNCKAITRRKIAKSWKCEKASHKQTQHAISEEDPGQVVKKTRSTSCTDSKFTGSLCTICTSAAQTQYAQTKCARVASASGRPKKCKEVMRQPVIPRLKAPSPPTLVTTQLIRLLNSTFFNPKLLPPPSPLPN